MLHQEKKVSEKEIEKENSLKNYIHRMINYSNKDPQFRSAL